MKFVCEKCRGTYDTFAEAERCETMKPRRPPRHQVGDIVTYQAGYHWYDGDPRWVINPDVDPKKRTCQHNCFDLCCTWGFFYVITAIETDHNRYLYHLVTSAMTGASGHARTLVTSPTDLKKVEDPPAFVVEDSKRFIGERVSGHRSYGPMPEEWEEAC